VLCLLPATDIPAQVDPMQVLGALREATLRGVIVSAQTIANHVNANLILTTVPTRKVSTRNRASSGIT
jgi:hypothetical protein